MKKLLSLFLVLLSTFCGGVSSFAQPMPTQRRGESQNAACVLAWLDAHLNVREATGHNDGPAVAAIVRASGGDPRDHPEWCGFTRAAANRSCGLPYPAGGRQGAAAAWFRPGPRLVYQVGAVGRLEELRPGLCAGIWHDGGIHHITTVAELGRPVRAGRVPRTAWCKAGNESSGANAGVHRTCWPVAALYALSNWNY